MNYLLFGGASSVGKSHAIYRLAWYLLSIKNYKDELNKMPKEFKDFCLLIEGIDKQGKAVKIVINSPTDDPYSIKQLKLFCDTVGDLDIFVSSIRDDSFKERKLFLKTMKISKEDYICEIPMAKITRKKNNKILAMKWYEEKIDNIAITILQVKPFEL